jgi:hypothetical protein
MQIGYVLGCYISAIASAISFVKLFPPLVRRFKNKTSLSFRYSQRQVMTLAIMVSVQGLFVCMYVVPGG